MMNKKYFLLIVCFFTFVSSHITAQVGVQYSQYYLNQASYNPGYTGSDEYANATVLFRDQWLNIEGEPLSQAINFNMPVSILRGGIGLQLVNEKLGAYNALQIGLAYAYKQSLSIGEIALGFRGGFTQSSLDGNILRSPEGNYEGGLIVHNDGLIPTNNERSIIPNLAVGLSFVNEKITTGISLNNVLKPVLSLNTLSIAYNREIYFDFAYHLKLSDELNLHPSIFMRTDGIKIQQDITALAEYQKTFFAGLSLRGVLRNNTDALIVLTGVRLNNKLQIGYSYDLGISSLRNYHTGSHEIVINYKVDIKNKRKSVYFPRFL